MLIKKQSPINEIGIFTDSLLKRETIVYIVPTAKIHDKPTSKCAYIGNNHWIDDEKVLNWINHSCNPNCRLSLGNQPQLISINDILPNEELTVDYDQTEHGNKEIKCNCKGKNCRNAFRIK